MPKRFRVLTVTGHREITKNDRRAIRRRVRNLVSDSTVRRIYFGGARGTDTYALSKALKYRGNSKYPKLIVVVPNTLADQPGETQEVSLRADRVVELKLGPLHQAWVFQKRNEYMVLRSTGLEAFRNPAQPYGGTHNCILFALKRLPENCVHYTNIG